MNKKERAKIAAEAKKLWEWCSENTNLDKFLEPKLGVPYCSDSMPWQKPLLDKINGVEYTLKPFFDWRPGKIFVARVMKVRTRNVTHKYEREFSLS